MVRRIYVEKKPALRQEAAYGLVEFQRGGHRQDTVTAFQFHRCTSSLLSGIFILFLPIRAVIPAHGFRLYRV